MLQVVLFLAGVSAVSYLIPIVSFLFRPAERRERVQPVRERPPKPAIIRNGAGNQALERMVQIVEDDRLPPHREPTPAPHTDKVVKLR
jgi:hypothetical protein